MRAIAAIAFAAGVFVVGASAAGHAPHMGPVTDSRLVYADGHANCNKAGFKRYDMSQYYTANSNLTKALCVVDYLDVCYTAQGAMACNPHRHKCVDSNIDWDDARFQPHTAANMRQRPQLCQSEGAYWDAETGVTAVGQPVTSFVLSVFLISVVFKGAKERNVGWFPMAILVCQSIWCTLLCFSFWYLNGLVALGATLVTIGMLATKDRAGIAVCLVVCIATLYWMTFASGLGGLQHHMRFTDAVTSYEMTCNNYYRGFFGYPVELHKPYVSPNDLYRGYCLREWIAADFFFVIMAELQLMLVICVAAGHLLSEPEESKSEETVAAAATE